MDDAEIRSLLDSERTHDATTEVIRQAGPDILRFLLATARDEDIASEAFSVWCERMWRTLPTFRWDCSLRSWCYLVAKSAFYDHVRAERRKQRRRQPLESEQIANVAAQVRTATLSLYRAENLDAMTRLRASLDDDDRLLLVLRVDRDLQWNEIAEVFLRDDEDLTRPTEADLTREAARLRKRFQHVKERLYELATEAGLIER